MAVGPYNQEHRKDTSLITKVSTVEIHILFFSFFFQKCSHILDETGIYLFILFFFIDVFREAVPDNNNVLSSMSMPVCSHN